MKWSVKKIEVVVWYNQTILEWKHQTTIYMNITNQLPMKMIAYIIYTSALLICADVSSAQSEEVKQLTYKAYLESSNIKKSKELWKKAVVLAEQNLKKN